MRGRWILGTILVLIPIITGFYFFYPSTQSNPLPDRGADEVGTIQSVQPGKVFFQSQEEEPFSLIVQEAKLYQKQDGQVQSLQVEELKPGMKVQVWLKQEETTIMIYPPVRSVTHLLVTS